MALLLDWPTTGGIGPGFSVEAHTTTLPVPNDDWLQVIVSTHLGNPVISANTPLSRFANTWIAHLGLIEVHGDLYPQVSYTVAAPSQGSLMDLSVYQYHANGTFVDQASVLGVLTWDATAMLWRLTAQGGSLFGPSTAELDQILAAVTAVYKNH